MGMGICFILNRDLCPKHISFNKNGYVYLCTPGYLGYAVARWEPYYPDEGTPFAYAKVSPLSGKNADNIADLLLDMKGL
jgi:hypothetical protein